MTPKFNCWQCGSQEIRPSLRQGGADWALAVLFLRPMRCKKCSRRFYRFTSRVAAFATPIVFLSAVILVAMIAYADITAPVPAPASSITAAPPEDNNELLDRLAKSPAAAKPADKQKSTSR